MSRIGKNLQAEINQAEAMGLVISRQKRQYGMSWVVTGPESCWEYTSEPNPDYPSLNITTRVRDDEFARVIRRAGNHCGIIATGKTKAQAANRALVELIKTREEIRASADV